MRGSCASGEGSGIQAHLTKTRRGEGGGSGPPDKKARGPDKKALTTMYFVYFVFCLEGSPLVLIKGDYDFKIPGVSNIFQWGPTFSGEV